MNELVQINGESLISELLASFVEERSGLYWSLPFSEEIHRLIVHELLTRNPISEI